MVERSFLQNNEEENSEGVQIGLFVVLELVSETLYFFPQKQRSSDYEFFIVLVVSEVGEAEVCHHRSVVIHHEDVRILEIEVDQRVIVEFFDGARNFENHVQLPYGQKILVLNSPLCSHQSLSQNFWVFIHFQKDFVVVLSLSLKPTPFFMQSDDVVVVCETDHTRNLFLH